MLLACVALLIDSAELRAEVRSAQTAAADRVVYSTADFAAYAPQTALDMVRRTPGFVLEEGDAGIRGYGAAGGNVLVDGALPVSKAGVVDFYANDGDWVESLTAITEADDGALSLVRWRGQCETLLELPAATQAPQQPRCAESIPGASAKARPQIEATEPATEEAD